MSREDDERLKNLLLFKMYCTDAERDKLMPWVLIITILVVGGMVLLGKLGN